MEDKCQVLSPGKPLQDEKLKEAKCPSCPSDHSITRSPDPKDCRECLGALVHRLAQPITALRGGIELGLMGRHSAADYRSLLEQSLQLADNMAHLIISLRDLGESGVSGGAAHCIALEPVATQALADLGALAQSRDLRLQLTTQGAAEVCANPERLQEALQSVIAWVIQNSAGGGVIALELSATAGEAQMFLSLSRLDLQYLQIKMLEDLTPPGVLFAHAAKNGALGWAISQRLLDGLGGRMEILTDGPNASCLRVSFPLRPQVNVENPS
jgi:signal transduction histidine kinase